MPQSSGFQRNFQQHRHPVEKYFDLRHHESTHDCQNEDLEKLDVVTPEGEALYVEAHLVESEVVRLSHLFLVGGQRRLRLLLTEDQAGALDYSPDKAKLTYLNIEQVGFPELNRKDSDETALEKELHPLIISSSDLLCSLIHQRSAVTGVSFISKNQD